MIIANRLEEVRVHLGLKKREFASFLGIHANSYTNYIHGSRDIPLEILRKVSNAYNISYEWLINGTGSMNKSSVLKETEYEYGSDNYHFCVTEGIPAADEIKKITKQHRLSFRNDSPDTQFLLSIIAGSEYLASPFVSRGDLLLCSSEAGIKDGDLVAARWSKTKSGIRICNYNKNDRNSLVLTALNQASPPLVIERGEVRIYKVLMIIKS